MKKIKWTRNKTENKKKIRRKILKKMFSWKYFAYIRTMVFIWFAFISFIFALNFPRKQMERSRTKKMKKNSMKSTAYISLKTIVAVVQKHCVYYFLEMTSFTTYSLHCGHTNANQIYHTWLFSYISSHLSSAFILVISPIYLLFECERKYMCGFL